MNLFDVFFLVTYDCATCETNDTLVCLSIAFFVCLFEMNEVVEDGFFFPQLYPYNCVTRETYDPLS